MHFSAFAYVHDAFSHKHTLLMHLYTYAMVRYFCIRMLCGAICYLTNFLDVTLFFLQRANLNLMLHNQYFLCLTQTFDTMFEQFFSRLRCACVRFGMEHTLRVWHL